MSLNRINDVLHVDGVALPDVARAVGTPTYVYSWNDIETRYRALAVALGGLDHRICYAVKANSNLALLHRLSRLGAGFDIVSGGELERVLVAGGNAEDVVFSGVGKSVVEIDFALKAGIGCFNVESDSELTRIEARAKLLGATAPISVRVNPDVDARTHPYISTGLKENKFGVPEATALAMYRRAAASDALEVKGIDCHIGSQISDVGPYEEALVHLLDLADRLTQSGIALEHVDLGGGLGIDYNGEGVLPVEAYGRMLASRLSDRGLRLYVEPGRYLVGDAGILLSRVEYLKPALQQDDRSFAVVDAAMNDLIRPALYDAHHRVEAVTPGPTTGRWDVVGPVCESGDFLALDRTLPLEEGSLIAIRTAGAYGFVQSSNYNTRPRPAEVLVDGDEFKVARLRESTSDLFRDERVV